MKRTVWYLIMMLSVKAEPAPQDKTLVAGRSAARSFVFEPANKEAVPPDDLVLNCHLMHSRGGSRPGDPNAAVGLDGVYHLHYILWHPWKGGHSFSFMSPVPE